MAKAKAFAFSVFGDKKLKRAFKRLGQKVEQKVLKGAAGLAMNPILSAARRLVPVRSGQLKRSLGKRARTYKGIHIVFIGPRSGFKTLYKDRRVNPTQYAHLVEFGTVNSPARPFLRPAYDANRMAVLSRLRKEVGKRIEREVKKLRAA